MKLISMQYVMSPNKLANRLSAIAAYLHFKGNPMKATGPIPENEPLRRAAFVVGLGTIAQATFVYNLRDCNVYIRRDKTYQFGIESDFDVLGDDEMSKMVLVYCPGAAHALYRGVQMEKFITTCVLVGESSIASGLTDAHLATAARRAYYQCQAIIDGDSVENVIREGMYLLSIAFGNRVVFEPKYKYDKV